MKRLLNFGLFALLLAFVLPARAVTYPQVITGSLGAGYIGQTGNVKYSVTDAAGVTQIAATATGITEETGADGVTGTGSYSVVAAFNPTWAFPVKVKFTVTGQNSVAAFTVINQRTVDSVFGATVQGGLTYLQWQNLQQALSFDADRTYNKTTHIGVATWYARLANGSGPDKTRPMYVKTTQYANDDIQVSGFTVAITVSNLN